MRLDRKNRTDKDLGLVNKGGFLDLFDNSVKEALRINDKEYDYLCENMTDEDMDLLVMDSKTFSQRKKQVLMVETHLSNMKKIF